MERNEKKGLCYLIKVTKVERIEGKDRIAFIYNNKNNFKCTVNIEDAVVGNEFVYFEVDSMIPLNYTGDKEELNPIFSFLKVTAQKNASYAVIKARKMGALVSMGLAIPLVKSGLNEKLSTLIKEGKEDFTEFFALKKYTPPLANGGAKCLEYYNALYHGNKNFTSLPSGSYPTELTDKSDEENLYAVEEEVFKSYFDKNCYATLKMDGTSITLQVKYDEKKDPTFYIFGHSILSDNTYMYKYFSEKLDKDGLNVFDRMVKYHEKEGENLLLCGEFYGPKIQGNPYHMEDYAFDIYKVVFYKDNNSNRHVASLNEMLYIAGLMKTKTVPIIAEGNFNEVCKSLNVEVKEDAKETKDALYRSVEKLCFKDDFRQYNLEEDGEYHEGIVITSIEGHSDSLLGEENKGWSFKLKSEHYQAR